MPADQSEVLTGILFDSIAEWRQIARVYLNASERCAAKAMRSKSKRVQNRMWKAYELGIMRCPSPHTTVKQCATCAQPNGHPGPCWDTLKSNPSGEVRR